MCWIWHRILLAKCKLTWTLDVNAFFSSDQIIWRCFYRTFAFTPCAKSGYRFDTVCCQSELLLIHKVRFDTSLEILDDPGALRVNALAARYFPSALLPAERSSSSKGALIMTPKAAKARKYHQGKNHTRKNNYRNPLPPGTLMGHFGSRPSETNVY